MSRHGFWLVSLAALALAGAAWQWLAVAPQPIAPAQAAPVSDARPLAPLTPESVARAASVPAQAPDPEPTASAPAWLAGIGSEGFGPHVQHALDSGDPREALKAARWIGRCRPERDLESMINGSHPKYRLVLPPEARIAVINRERQVQRFCQTLTQDQMAQHQALALRALQARVPGAGQAYYDTLDPESRSPEEVERALKGLRVDAAAGQETAVSLLALQELGQSRVERLAYTRLMNLLILKDVLPPSPDLTPPSPPDPPYSAEEQAAAAALVQRLWPQFKVPG